MDIVQSKDDAIKYKSNADQIRDKGKVNQGKVLWCYTMIPIIFWCNLWHKLCRKQGELIQILELLSTYLANLAASSLASSVSLQLQSLSIKFFLINHCFLKFIKKLYYFKNSIILHIQAWMKEEIHEMI